ELPVRAAHGRGVVVARRRDRDPRRRAAARARHHRRICRPHPARNAQAAELHRGRDGSRAYEKREALRASGLSAKHLLDIKYLLFVALGLLFVYNIFYIVGQEPRGYKTDFIWLRRSGARSTTTNSTQANCARSPVAVACSRTTQPIWRASIRLSPSPYRCNPLRTSARRACIRSSTIWLPKAGSAMRKRGLLRSMPATVSRCFWRLATIARVPCPSSIPLRLQNRPSIWTIRSRKRRSAAALRCPVFSRSFWRSRTVTDIDLPGATRPRPSLPSYRRALCAISSRTNI